MQVTGKPKLTCFDIKKHLRLHLRLHFPRAFADQSLCSLPFASFIFLPSAHHFLTLRICSLSAFSSSKYRLTEGRNFYPFRLRVCSGTQKVLVKCSINGRRVHPGLNGSAIQEQFCVFLGMSTRLLLTVQNNRQSSDHHILVPAAGRKKGGRTEQALSSSGRLLRRIFPESHWSVLSHMVTQLAGCKGSWEM